MPPAVDASARADDDASADKTKLRAAARDGRSRLHGQRRAEAAISIATHMLSLPEVRDAECVSIYASRDTEPGTLPLLESLHARGVRLLLPMLGDGLQRGWAEFTSRDDLEERAPGRPPEPTGEFLPPEALADADLIIVPALGADVHGTRLGQGGGWYDRALPYGRAGVKRIAVTFEEELRGDDDLLPVEPHDIPVDAIVTPAGVTWVKDPQK